MFAVLLFTVLQHVQLLCYSTVLQHGVTARCYSTVLQHGVQHGVTERCYSTVLQQVHCAGRIETAAPSKFGTDDSARDQLTKYLTSARGSSEAIL